MRKPHLLIVGLEYKMEAVFTDSRRLIAERLLVDAMDRSANGVFFIVKAVAVIITALLLQEETPGST